MASTGRPTKYTEKLADEICKSIAGGKSLSKVCQEGENYPHPSNVYEWLIKEKSFREKYQEAKSIQAECFSDQIIDIADDCKPIRDHVSKAKLQIDSRMWHNSKFKPKKYGANPTEDEDGEVIVQSVKVTVVKQDDK